MVLANYILQNRQIVCPWIHLMFFATNHFLAFGKSNYRKTFLLQQAMAQKTFIRQKNDDRFCIFTAPKNVFRLMKKKDMDALSVGE